MAAAATPVTAGSLHASGPALYAQAQSDSGAPVDIYGFKKKSPARAFLQSFLIPGWGQVYNGSAFWKPVAFVGIEASGWLGVAHFHGNGNKKQDDYRAFADQHWDSAGYFNGLYHVYYLGHYTLPPGYDRRYVDTLSYFLIDSATEIPRTWSHHAFFKDESKPVPRDEYYENVGKYNQFAFGWDDYPKIGDTNFPRTPEDTSHLNYVPPHRHQYLVMRDKANKEYKKASTILVLTIGNHLLSAFEAAIGARRYNHAQDQFGGVETRMRLARSPGGRGYMPTLTLGYRF